MRYLLGVDVGTASVRAGVFDERGARLASASRPIQLFYPEADHVEHSSDDIWRATCEAVRAAVAEARVAPEQIVGLGFDATCSLVALGPDDEPVTVSVTGQREQNVIVWMDHRATEQAARINRTGNEVLTYVGGTISPEMQTPKLLWLKEHLPASYARTRLFLDLPDFLVYRATGVDVRSLCTTVCKWTYLGHQGGFQPSFFEAVGLGDLAADGFRRIGQRVRPMGERAGGLSARAAAELGLAPDMAVSVAIIDAHAGGVGMLGVGDGDIEERLALIGGTSTCHMAVSREPRFVPGVWGPYFSAMVPGLWLTEGGQSATGALIDHVITSHALGERLAADARQQGTTVYALLNARLDQLAAASGVAHPGALCADLHVLPDHHGNRSPRADPTLRGMVSGLRLSSSLDELALLYLATIQGLAHGTRHVLDALRQAGHRTRVLVAAGGDTKNPVFLREHADATGCPIALPREPESVLLGASMLGAVAAGVYPTVEAAMGAMAASDRVIEPSGGAVAAYHARKHAVFLRLYDDQMAYRALMKETA